MSGRHDGSTPRVVFTAGARPNFMKLGPIWRAVEARGELASAWIDTSQHDDPAMRADVLTLFGIPAPQARLTATTERGETRLAHMREGVSLALEDLRPDGLVVIGDVDGSRAAAEAAHARGIPVAHVEAGLRSGDATMVEERNRVAIDQLAALHLVTEEAGVDHLRAEGLAGAGVQLVGNPMVDALHHVRERLGAAEATLAAEDRPVLVTLHRAGNVDTRERLEAWVEAIEAVSDQRPVLWLLHPRTEDRLAAFELLARVRALPRVSLLPPQSYVDAMGHLLTAHALLTDSGGMPIEAAVLGIPCVVLRGRFEHPALLASGAVRLAHAEDAMPDRGALLAHVAAARSPAWVLPSAARHGDGQAATRIARALATWLG